MVLSSMKATKQNLLGGRTPLFVCFLNKSPIAPFGKLASSVVSRRPRWFSRGGPYWWNQLAPKRKPVPVWGMRLPKLDVP